MNDKVPVFRKQKEKQWPERAILSKGSFRHSKVVLWHPQRITLTTSKESFCKHMKTEWEREFKEQFAKIAHCSCEMITFVGQNYKADKVVIARYTADLQ